MEDELLTVEEAARYLQLNEQTVRAMARQGRLVAFKVGRSWRFRKSDLGSVQESSLSHSAAVKLLVIDDDPLVHHLLEASLQQYKPLIYPALNGEEGLAILATNEIDVVSLDLSMPGMSGPETLRQIREMKGNIPVVIITSFPESNLMEEAMKYGPIILLAKPFFPQQACDCFAGLLGLATSLD